MDECEFEQVCLNKGKCYRCPDQQLLKLPKEKKTKRKVYDYKKANDKDSWKDLEQTVAQKLNNIPSIKDARRSRASGALWFEKLDIVDMILGPECKERMGREIQQGADKSFSMKRSWLEKASKEAKEAGKIMILPWRFKGDETIYANMEFDDIAELVTMYKELVTENQLLRNKLKQQENKPEE